MLTRNDLRIAAALFASLLVHGALLTVKFGPDINPVAAPARQKLSIRLAARQPPPQTEQVQQDLPEKIPEQPVPRLARQKGVPPRKTAIKSRAVPKPLAARVDTLPAEPPRQTARPAKAVPAPQEVQELQASPVAEGQDQMDKPAVIMARPLYRENPPPSYPAKARRRHLEGTVILEVQVSREGRVENLSVKESSGHRILDRAAVSSVEQWIFEPGRRNGVRVAMTVLVPVRFSLH